MGLKQTGFASPLILGLVLLVVIGAGAYYFWSGKSESMPVITDQQNVAAPAGETPDASLILESEPASKSEKLAKGDTFTLVVKVKSKENLNLFSAQINYPKEIITARNIRKLEPETVELWVEKKIDTDNGSLKLTGGTPSPGFKTEDGGIVTLAKIDFEVTGENIPDSFKISSNEVQLFKNNDSQLIDKAGGEPLIFGKQVLGTNSGASMIMSPAEVSANVGCTFEIKIYLDSGGHTIDGADAVIKFDPNYLSPVKLSQGTITSDEAVFKIFTKGDYFYFSNVMPTTFNSKGTMGIVTMKAVKATGETPTELSFKYSSADPQNTTDSNVVERSTIKDVLGTATGAKVKIGTGDCGTTTSTEASSSASVATSSAILAQKDEGDANGDGRLDLSDVSALLMDYNKKGDSLLSDLNGDGRVNGLDFSIVVKNLFKKGVLSL